MQQLEERNTYTPTDVPQVRLKNPSKKDEYHWVFQSSNCDPALNREETLSVLGLKTSSNNSDAALTGFGSSRVEHCICCKNFFLLTKEHDRRFVNPASINARGQIPPYPFG